MDFSKEFEILGKLDEDWRDHMANVGGAQPYTRKTPNSGSTSSTHW